MIHEPIRNENGSIPDLAYARGAGSREQGGRSRDVGHPCLSSNWGRTDRPLMDGGSAAPEPRSLPGHPPNCGCDHCAWERERGHI